VREREREKKKKKKKHGKKDGEKGLRDNDEVASYGSRDSYVALFGEGNKISLCFNF
jgi:hypothetical protein